MNKGQLASAVKASLNDKYNKKSIIEIIDTSTEIITEALVTGEKVIIQNFLSLKVDGSSARTRYNICTQKVEPIEANCFLTLNCSDYLLRKIQRSKNCEDLIKSM